MPVVSCRENDSFHARLEPDSVQSIAYGECVDVEWGNKADHIQVSCDVKNSKKQNVPILPVDITDPTGRLWGQCSPRYSDDQIYVECNKILSILHSIHVNVSAGQIEWFLFTMPDHSLTNDIPILDTIHPCSSTTYAKTLQYSTTCVFTIQHNFRFLV